MNIRSLARRVFINTLEANASYRSLVAWPGTSPVIYRTFGDHVPANVPLPYVTIDWYSGGNIHVAKTQESRSFWKIVVNTEENEVQAEAISDAINAALDGVWPVMGSITTFGGYNPILLKYPFSDVAIRQNRSIYRMGGIYALYLAEIKG